MIAPEQERAVAATGPAFTDAVTFSFSDPESDLHGLARLGMSPDGDDARAGSALGVLFAGREPATALARGGVPLPADADWAVLRLPGLATSVEEPLRRWTLRFDGEAGDGGAYGFSLTFEALGPPAELPASDPAARAGGMSGYEQLCVVTGEVRVGGRAVRVRCLGQRGHAWGEPDWDRIEAVRTLSAWLPDGSGVALTAVRPAGARDHAQEATWAALLHPTGALPVDDPRLSTTYDGAGRQRRAGLELWVGEEDEDAHRAAGEAVCGAALDLGQLRLDCAFFRWHMDGREGVGRYDLLRRA